MTGIEINWTALAFGMAVVSNFVAAGTWVFVYIGKRHAATDDDVEAVESRVTRLEGRVDALPSLESVHMLDKHVVELSGDIKVIGKALEGYGKALGRMESVLERHEEHLLSAAGKAK